MHSTKHATAATEWATCIYSDPDHAHVATCSTSPTDALWASTTDDGSEHLGRSKQR